MRFNFTFLLSGGFSLMLFFSVPSPGVSQDFAIESSSFVSGGGPADDGNRFKLFGSIAPGTAVQSSGSSYTVYGGFVAGLVDEEPEVLIGDVNLDGIVNLLDVGPFVSILSSDGFQAEADINEDGVVDLLDVTPFVTLLTGI